MKYITWVRTAIVASLLMPLTGVPTANGADQIAQTPPSAGHQGMLFGAPQNMNQQVQFSVGPRNVKALLIDGENVWIGTSSGLIRYNVHNSDHTVYDNKSGLLSNGIFYVGKIKGEVWVGTYGGGLSIFDPRKETWRTYNIPHGMADAFIYDALESSNGDIWLATWSGANRIVGGDMDNIESWLLYTVENTDGGLPNDWVYGLSEGRDGIIWFATEGGLARFDHGTWANWQHADGLGAPYETVEDALPYKSDPGSVSGHHARQKVEQGLEDVAVAYNPNYIVALEVDGEGNVWAGTWGGGLSRFDGKDWQTYTVADGLPGNHVFSLGQDAQGNLWIGTSRGLARYDGQGFENYYVSDGLVSDTVFSIATEGSNNMWVGTYGGTTWFPSGLTR